MDIQQWKPVPLLRLVIGQAVELWRWYRLPAYKRVIGSKISKESWRDALRRAARQLEEDRRRLFVYRIEGRTRVVRYWTHMNLIRLKLQLEGEKVVQ